MIEKPPVHVVAAVIERDGRFLLALRPKGKALAGHWEFPGGKVEAGELPHRALARELEEELGATQVQILEQLGQRRHDYATGSVLIDARRVSCDLESLKPIEHDKIDWFSPEQMQSIPLAPADLFLIDLITSK